MERSAFRGIAALRWIGWVWMATVQVLARGSLERPVVAVGLVALALGVTVWTTLLLRRDPSRLRSVLVVGVELAVAAALLVADGWVYDDDHVFSTEQSLGVAWPLAGVLSAGAAFGARSGLTAGLVMGLARAVSSVVHNPGPAAGDPELVLGLGAAQALSLVSTTVLYAVAGAVAGYAVGLFRRAERDVARAEAEVATVRAREEVARTLHDGVLQTLAAVERRAEDPALARLAREQDRDLRRFLFGASGDRLVGSGDLGDALREAAARCEAAHGVRIEVLVPDDLPVVAPDVVAALAGAAGEAMNNAGKHAAAGRVVVYVEPEDGGVFCSVRDDGRGFDVTGTAEGVGLSRSIRDRIAEVHGTVEVESEAGAGTEVRLHVPAASA